MPKHAAILSIWWTQHLPFIADIFRHLGYLITPNPQIFVTRTCIFQVTVTLCFDLIYPVVAHLYTYFIYLCLFSSLLHKKNKTDMFFFLHYFTKNKTDDFHRHWHSSTRYLANLCAVENFGNFFFWDLNSQIFLAIFFCIE